MVDAIMEAALLGVISTFPLILGAWISLRFKPSSRIVGIIMGFGAGALISAVAYELIPGYSPGQMGLFFAVGIGAAVFYLATSSIERRSSAKRRGGESAKARIGKTIVLGALLDGIPESLVLGMSLVLEDAVSIAFLGAVFVSNLPESIGASSEMAEGGMPRSRIYKMWLIVMAACIGATFLGAMMIQYLPGVEGVYLSAFAAGAVLVVLSDSMIPEGFSEGGRPTGLMVVLGFSFASILSFLG